jgi:hypothetical protein
MNNEGYRLVSDALQEAGVEPFQIDPQLEEDQDIDRFAVIVPTDITSEQIEEAFRSSGLSADMLRPRAEQMRHARPVVEWRNSSLTSDGTERRVEFVDITTPVDSVQ